MMGRKGQQNVLFHAILKVIPYIVANLYAEYWWFRGILHSILRQTIGIWRDK